MKMELFAKIMGMTGSEHDGEALAALRKAQAMLAGAKMTWADVLKAGGGGQTYKPGNPYTGRTDPPPWEDSPYTGPRGWGNQQHRRAVDQDVVDAFKLMDEFPEKITEWEEDFLLSRSQDEWSDYMSDKQRAIMERLAKRYRMLSARGAR